MRKTVANLVFDEVEVLDFAGPFEVFAVADELRSHSVFSVVTVAPRTGVVRARNGLNIVPHYDLDACPRRMSWSCRGDSAPAHCWKPLWLFSGYEGERMPPRRR